MERKRIVSEQCYRTELEGSASQVECAPAAGHVTRKTTVLKSLALVQNKAAPRVFGGENKIEPRPAVDFRAQEQSTSTRHSWVQQSNQHAFGFLSKPAGVSASFSGMHVELGKATQNRSRHRAVQNTVPLFSPPDRFSKLHYSTATKASAPKNNVVRKKDLVNSCPKTCRLVCVQAMLRCGKTSLDKRFRGCGIIMYAVVWTHLH